MQHPTGGRSKAFQARSPLAAIRGAGRGVSVGVLVFSGFMNLLTLTGPLYMLQVYDRVVPSRSVPTLIGLSALAALMYLGYAFLDQVRSRILVRAGLFLEAEVYQTLFRAIVSAPLSAPRAGDGLAPLRDLDTVRSFVVSSGPAAFFDLPFLPLQVAICFLVNPVIGWATVLGAAVIFALAVATNTAVRDATHAVSGIAGVRQATIEAARRNAEVVRVMGMAGRLGERWAAINRGYEAARLTVQDRSVAYSGVSRVFRMLFQTAVLGLGAWLVIEQQAAFGVMIAASILSARALQPVEQLVASWRSVVASRQAWQRLAPLLSASAVEPATMRLPVPSASFAAQGVAVVPPGAQRAAVANVSFLLAAGSGLGIIGPSGAGKSSLVRALVGAWAPAAGHVRIDGADLSQWDADLLGRHIGYLPQDVELFAGSVADNIARFSPDADPASVVAAAQAAGIHDTILRLPAGYATDIGEAGAALSAGQRQRLALARALFGDPFLVVLDEPNSNLDAEGEASLARAIVGVRQRGGIVVVVAHRPSTLEGVDHVLALVDGAVFGFGGKEEVFRHVLPRPSAQGSVPVRPGEASEAQR